MAPPPVIEVVGPLSFGLETILDRTYSIGEEITTRTLPPAAGGTGERTYVLTPDLPAGLVVNTQTRVLSGTPTVAQSKTTYTWTVTDADPIDPSSARLTFTIGVRPAPPDSLTVLTGDSQATLTWKAPADSSLAGWEYLTGWEYRQKYGYWRNDWDDWTPILDSDAATRSHLVTNLNPDMAYSFEVRAVVGTGEAAVPSLASNHAGPLAELGDVDGDDQITIHDFFLAGKAAVGLPDAAQLYQNAPNPFNSQTVLSYFLRQPGSATLEVFSLTGQRVARLHQGPQQMGVHRIRWNGHDDFGRPVASGMYLYRLVTEERVLTRKLILLR